MVVPMKVSDVFDDLPAVETERLLLRKMTLDDAEDMFRYASDPEVTRYTTWEPHRSLEESRQFVQATVDAYGAGEVRNWGVVHKKDKRMIGTAGFIWWRTDSASAEVGYAMARDYWGRGLMTEAVKAIVRFGFEQMKLNRIAACCDAGNSASARVLEKVGMLCEGTLRDQIVADGEFSDMKLYAVLLREWSPE